LLCENALDDWQGHCVAQSVSQSFPLGAFRKT
jgi:hypothetical protein